MKVIIRCALFFALLGACLLIASRILMRKEGLRKYSDLHAALPRADVLFLGSSHVINGINPAELFDSCGIASYNLGGHGSTVPASYYELLLALREASPALVVVDGYMAEREYTYLDLMTPENTDAERENAVGQLHLNLDAFPLSRVKVYTVHALISDRKKREEFLFPFLIYHDRWSGLTADDPVPGMFSAQANRLLGGEIRTGVDWHIEPHEGEEEPATEPLYGETYLQMILALCRERGIDMAFTMLPFNTTPADRRTAARLSVLAQAEGVPYLDLTAAGTDSLQGELFDDGHLNLIGMHRTTEAVGRFLAEQFDLPDRRGDADYSLWQRRAEEYRETLTGLQYGPERLTDALSALAADPDAPAAILYLRPEAAAIGDPAVRNLLDAVVPGNQLREAAAAGAPALFLFSRGGEEVQDLCGYRTQDWQESVIGLTELVQVERFTGLYLDHDESFNLLDMDEGRLSDAQLM
ncbi:MAG: hypothetical protein IKO80_10335, partial [Lachnospiraceae bacterium]|nr:hypothetical protein [Lachnospiraceae bacterium]